MMIKNSKCSKKVAHCELIALFNVLLFIYLSKVKGKQAKTKFAYSKIKKLRHSARHTCKKYKLYLPLIELCYIIYFHANLFSASPPYYKNSINKHNK